jgi:hypothetical protein
MNKNLEGPENATVLYRGAENKVYKIDSVTSVPPW